MYRRENREYRFGDYCNVFKTSRIHTHETTFRIILMILIKRSPEYLDIVEIVGVLTSDE